MHTGGALIYVIGRIQIILYIVRKLARLMQSWSDFIDLRDHAINMCTYILISYVYFSQF